MSDMTEAKKEADVLGPNFRVDKLLNAEQLKDDVSFNDVTLDNAVREQAALFVHYAQIAARSRRQYERIKGSFEVLESVLSAQHREALVEEGKKATEAMVDAAVKTDPRWFNAYKRLIEAREIMDLANDGRSAFDMRKDMLVQATADRRREAEGEMRVRAAQEASATVRDRVAAIVQQQAKSAA